ncbi:MAG: hypothetical protein P8163_22465, partial [Candidatus Thiodiazotropha sp.]
MFDYDENRFDGHGHLLGESRYNVNCTLVAAHGGVATPWNSTLFRVVARRDAQVSRAHGCAGAT